MIVTETDWLHSLFCFRSLFVTGHPAVVKGKGLALRRCHVKTLFIFQLN